MKDKIILTLLIIALIEIFAGDIPKAIMDICLAILVKI